MGTRIFLGRSLRRGGFTLVELLVVIGIIALLAAIVVPVYFRALENGRQADCISKLHGLAVALKLYFADYEAYPPPPYFNEARADWIGGFGSLWEGNYISSQVGLRCRDDNQPGPEKTYSSYSQWYNYLGYDDKGNAVPAVWEQIPGTPDFSIDLAASLANAKTYYAPGGTVLLDERGRPLWNLAVSPPNGTFTGAFPGLINRLAPDETIVTHCAWHRTFYGRGHEFDLAARLGGNVSKINVSSYSAGNRWQLQPLEK